MVIPPWGDGVGVHPLTLVSCWFSAVPGDIYFLSFSARTQGTLNESCVYSRRKPSLCIGMMSARGMWVRHLWYLHTLNPGSTEHPTFAMMFLYLPFSPDYELSEGRAVSCFISTVQHKPGPEQPLSKYQLIGWMIEGISDWRLENAQDRDHKPKCLQDP